MMRVEYHDVAVGAAEDATVTATGASSESTPSLIPFGSGNSGEFIMDGLNAWVLDGSKAAYDGEDVAFWSTAESDNNGDFSTAPTITVAFANQYTSLGISLVFHGDSWCNDLNITWKRSGTTLDTKDFTPDGNSYFCENTVQNYDSVVITFRSMSLPYRRLRIDSILFGLVRIFKQDELRSGSVKIVQEIDPTSRELVANTMDLRLSSKSAVEYMFQFKQPVYAYDSNTLIGIFYIDDAERKQARVYDISCIDAIGILDNDPFPDAVYTTNKNAYTLAQEICGSYPLTMDASLQSKNVKGALVGQTRRGALQQLCFALCAVADTSGDSGIVIKKLATSGSDSVPQSRVRTGLTVKKDPIVTEVQVAAHTFSTSSSGGGDQIKINGTTYYDKKTITTITNPNVTPSDKPNVISVEDATLVGTANVAEVAQWLYDRVSDREIADLKFRVVTEKMGDRLEVPTPWEDTVTGYYVRGSLTLSSFVLSDAEVRGS